MGARSAASSPERTAARVDTADLLSAHGLHADIDDVGTTVEPGRHGRKKILIAIGVTACALAIGIAGMRAASAPPARAEPSLAASSAIETIASAPAPLSGAPEPPSTGSVAKPPLATSASSNGSPIRVLPPPRATAKSTSSGRPAPKTDRDCNPPYDLDARGIKRYKPQCF
jgi:serine/threonine-protein kinase